MWLKPLKIVYRVGVGSVIKSTAKNIMKRTKQTELSRNKKWRGINSKYQAEWRKKNPEKVKQYTQTSLTKHKIENKERLKRWRAKNSNHVKEYNRAWLKENKEHVRKRSNEYRRYKFKNDINFRIAVTMRSRLRSALKDIRKDKNLNEYLGCSIENLKSYLESKFQPGMSWENYGEWHIDHIRPLSSFDLADEKQLHIVCHYTNLQPLWAEDNLRKGKSVELDNDNKCD